MRLSIGTGNFIPILFPILVTSVISIILEHVLSGCVHVTVIKQHKIHTKNGEGRYQCIAVTGNY